MPPPATDTKRDVPTTEPGTADRDAVTCADCLELIEESTDDDGCPECARSYGPHYRGPCAHGDTCGDLRDATREDCDDPIDWLE